MTYRFLHAGLLATVIMTGVNPQPLVAEDVTFVTPVPANVILSSGVRFRGELIGITPKSVTIQYRGRKITYPNSRVRFLVTDDKANSLKYRPGVYRYSTVLKAAKKLNERLKADRKSGTTPDSSPDGADPKTPRVKSSPSPPTKTNSPTNPDKKPADRAPHKPNDGSSSETRKTSALKRLGRIPFGSTSRKQDEPPEEANQPDRPRPSPTTKPRPRTSGSRSTSNSTTRVVTGKRCGACGKSVSTSFSAGDTCPHCGVTWSKEVGDTGDTACGMVGSLVCIVVFVGMLLGTIGSILFRRE